MKFETIETVHINMELGTVSKVVNLKQEVKNVVDGNKNQEKFLYRDLLWNGSIGPLLFILYPS